MHRPLIEYLVAFTDDKILNCHYSTNQISLIKFVHIIIMLILKTRNKLGVENGKIWMM